jgi:hypothetical protein
MNVELTIQEMFDGYPTLFKDRADCLNHLFCTIGNGYKWKDGELVECCGSYDIPNQSALKLHLVDGKAFQHNKLSLRGEAVYYASRNSKDDYSHYPEKVKQELIKADKKYYESLPDDVYHKYPRKQRWSFYLGGYCTRFAKLFNYPDDIKQDWLDAIEECKQMLIEDGYDVDHPDENPIDTAANWQTYREVMRKREWLT